MDTQPIYELRERLRAASIAGTGLLSEDFRLKRAYEAFQPLEAASPVFAKIGQLAGQLISPDCKSPQGTLLDALSLTDAVICTLGAVDATGELCSAKISEAENNAGSSHDLFVNVPYSILKGMTEALTTSGSGHYGYVCDMRKEHPEIFKDYRVKYAMVQALGASYAELADNVEEWLTEDNDRSVLPLLYRDFDPKGKKEMVRRVRVIEAVAGADANDFYIKMLDEAQKDVRQELISALRRDSGNTSLLLDMLKTEKGKNKDAVLGALANMEDERAHAYFSEMAVKKPETVIKHLSDAASTWSAGLVEEICDVVLERFDNLISAKDNSLQVSGSISLHELRNEEELSLSCLLYDVIRAMFGKGGSCICRCYMKLLERKKMINEFLAIREKKKNVVEQATWHYHIITNGVSGRSIKEAKKSFESGLGMILMQSLVVNPDEDLKALAIELYQNQTEDSFLSAAVMAKLFNDDDCIKWLDKQVTDKMLMVSKLSKERMNAVIEAAGYIRWNEEKVSYECFGSGYRTENLSVKRTVKFSNAAKITEWFKKYEIIEADAVLANWVQLNNEQMCKEMGEYFYKRALVTASNNRRYLDYMNRCGWTECKGLAVHFFKSRQNAVGQWELHEFLKNMPGNTECKRKEAETLSEKMKTGKINQGNIIVSGLDEWINKNL